MNQADYSDDLLVQKYDFLDKYDKLQTTIRQYLPCYMIAADWWLTFEYFVGLARNDPEEILGDAGPINNIRLLQLDSSYKLLSAPRLSNENVNTAALAEMNDWDRMSIRKDLKHREDFYLISGNVWRFLKNKYGGGPEIELLPESKGEQLDAHPSLILTNDDEPLIDRNIIVSLDLIKVFIVKEGENSSRFSKFISRTISMNNLLAPLASKLSLALSNAHVAYTNLGSKPIEVKDMNSTLFTIGLREGAIINICQRLENLHAEINIPTHLDFLKKDDEENSSKTDDNLLSTSTKDDGFNIIKFNSFEFDFPNRESDPAKFSTGTSNPNQNAFYDDPIFGNDQRPEVFVNFERENFPDLGTFLEKAKDSIGKQPISFGFKSIKQIRNDVDDMLHEWNFKSNHFSKKI